MRYRRGLWVGGKVRLCHGLPCLRRGGGGRRCRQVLPLRLQGRREHAVGTSDAGHRGGLRADALVGGPGAGHLLSDDVELGLGRRAVDSAVRVGIPGQVRVRTKPEKPVGQGRDGTLAVATDVVALSDAGTDVPTIDREANGGRGRCDGAGADRDTRKGCRGLAMGHCEQPQGAEGGHEQQSCQTNDALTGVEEQVAHGGFLLVAINDSQE